MADLTKIRNLKESQLNEIAIGEIVLNVDAMTYVTKNSSGVIVPYDIDYKLPDGDATHLYLKWDNTAQAYTARTSAEFLTDLSLEVADVESGSATALYLAWDDTGKIWKAKTSAEMKTALGYTTIADGSPVNAVASSVVLKAGNVPVDTKRVSIGGIDYKFVVSLSEGEVSGNIIEVLLEVSASLTLDNLISAINQTEAPTKYKNGREVAEQDFVVTATAGEGDTVLLTAKVKGVAGDSIAVSTDDANITFTDDASALKGGVNGTVGSKGDMYKDTDYIYIAIDDNTITDTNWRRIALGTAY